MLLLSVAKKEDSISKALLRIQGYRRDCNFNIKVNFLWTVVQMKQHNTWHLLNSTFQQIVCAVWNKAWQMSHSLATLLPFNFSVACPWHLPHITVCALTTPAPWKTLHVLTCTTTWPKYTSSPFTLTLCILPSTCVEHHRLPTMSKVVYVCVRKCFRRSPSGVPFLPDPKKKKKKRQQSVLLLQLSFQFVCHKCQGTQWCGYTQRAFLRKRGSRNRGAGTTVWRLLTNLSPVNTRSHSVADTQTGTFPAVVARAVLVQYTAAFTAVLPLGPAHRDWEVSYQKMEMCLDSSFQSKQLVKFIFVASNTLNLVKMYVKMTQYGNNNLQHRKMLTAKRA